ncbi:MAG: hypothetical protein NTV30_02435, partial [Chloroflexi bacterium]|nr:hypothetical protein [Chloroflexota bacterium]
MNDKAYKVLNPLSWFAPFNAIPLNPRLDNLKGKIILLYVASTNTYILRYSGNENLFLNGQNIFP